MNREIQAFAQEGARNHGLLNIAVDDFFNSKLVLPSIEEQQAIVAILTAADREIALLRQDLEQEKQKKTAGKYNTLVKISIIRASRQVIIISSFLNYLYILYNILFSKSKKP